MLKIVENLLKIKSIITILTTLAFIILLFKDGSIPQEFQLIYTTIIAFYFGTQTGAGKNDSNTANKNNQVQRTNG